MEKKETCPKCLGAKDMFDPNTDAMEKCNFCLGEGEVYAGKADAYDPIDTEEFMYEEDE